MRPSPVPGRHVSRSPPTTRHSVATIESETTVAIDTLTTAHAGSMTGIDARETEALDGLNSTYAASRSAHEALGPPIGERAVARGEEYAGQYESCKIHERDSFWAGYLTDRRAEAQQKAARETAKGYAKSIVDTATKQAREATKGRSKDRCGVIAAAGRARDTADEQLDALRGSLDAARVEAIAQADSMLAQVSSAIGATLDATLSALERQEHDQRQAASDTGYLQQLLIEQIAHSSASGVQVAVGQAVLTITDVFAQLRATFALSPAPDADALAGLLGQASAALGGGVAAVISQVEAGAGAASSLLGQAGARALAALEGVTTTNAEQAAAQAASLAETLGSLGSNATATFGQQTDAFVSQAQSTATEGASGLEQVATGFDQTCTAIAEQVTAALADSEQKLSESLLQTLTGLDSTSDGIPKQAREAASHEQPAWKSIVKWVLIIAIVIVVALVIGPAVIGAVGAAAASLGAGAAAGTIGTLVGGAIVGAATSATIQVVNNVADGRTWHQGIGRAAIMGAIGGAFGAGAGALIGKYVTTVAFQAAANVAADAVLEVGTQLVTGEFSWEALGMSVMMSVATGGFGEIGAVKGLQQRFMAAGAGVVPGAGARAYGDSIRPSTGAPEPGAGRPVPTEEPGAPGRPAGPEAGPSRAAPVPARPRPSRPGPTREAEVDGSPGAADEVETSTRVGDTDHQVSVRQRPEGAEVWVCSGACGPLKAHVDDILPHVAPDSPARGPVAGASRRGRRARGPHPARARSPTSRSNGPRSRRSERGWQASGGRTRTSDGSSTPAAPTARPPGRAADRSTRSRTLPPGGAARRSTTVGRPSELVNNFPLPKRQQIMSRLNQMDPGPQASC